MGLPAGRYSRSVGLGRHQEKPWGDSPSRYSKQLHKQLHTNLFSTHERAHSIILEYPREIRSIPLHPRTARYCESSSTLSSKQGWLQSQIRLVSLCIVSHVSNVSKDGGSENPLGNLSQSVNTITVIFLPYVWNFPHCALWTLPPVLLLCTSNRSEPVSSPNPRRYIWRRQLIPWPPWDHLFQSDQTNFPQPLLAHHVHQPLSVLEICP